MGILLTGDLTGVIIDHIENRIAKGIKVFWSCRKAIGKSWGIGSKNILWVFTAIVRPMLAYGAIIWWNSTLTASTVRQLSHLQRVACLAITGANNTTAEVADALLCLPALGTFIRGEARLAAFRLRDHINDLQMQIPKGHSKILKGLYNENVSLQLPSDEVAPQYNFVHLFETIVPDREDWVVGNPLQRLEGEFWYTDASVKPDRCGYGILDYSRNQEFSGRLNTLFTVKQAELATLQLCCRKIVNMEEVATPLIICTDSQHAIKAINGNVTRSRLVAGCIRELNILASHRRVTLLWTPSKSGIDGNCRADRLAKLGAAQDTITPTVALPSLYELARKTNDRWIYEQAKLSWNPTQTAYNTRQLLNEVNVEITRKLLSLKKAELRITIGVITGHIGLNKYKSRIGLRDDPDCDRCHLGEEIGIHFLCECPAWRSIKENTFGQSTL